MDIGECMDRLEGYGYAVSELMSRRWRHRKVYMDGRGLRIGLFVGNNGAVDVIDCCLLENGSFGRLLGSTAVHPGSGIGRWWVDGIGMDEMLSVLSEPGRAVMRFGTMKTEEDLGVLEG